MKWPYAPVQFTTAGEVADRTKVDAALRLLHPDGGPAPTDVLLVAHGWDNTIESAEQTFTRLCDNAADLAAQRPDADRRWAVVGLLWPSIVWADDGDHVAGGGLSTGAELPALQAAIGERIEDADVRARLQALAGELGVSGEARQQFLAQLRRALPDPAAVADDDPIPETLLSGDADTAFAAVKDAELAVADEEDGGPVAAPARSLPPGMVPDLLAGGTTTDGSAAGFSLADLDPARLARRLVNLASYYTMKARSGQVGTVGVAGLLREIGGLADPPRIHLCGHSFGARVVSAAGAATDVALSSVTLLQGAYSHYGLSGTSDPRGAFRRLLDGSQLRGPVVVTHTHNDKAVLVAYAVASRLARQIAEALGDENDPYGGLGANGAVETAEADAGALGDESATYGFRPRRVADLLADRFVSSHGDVTNRPVANALLQAMLAGARVGEPAAV